MKLKGAYIAETTYDTGDVVRYENVVYLLLHPCPAGTPPKNTRYWGRTSQPVADIVNIAMDAIELADSNDITLADNLTTETAGKALDATKGKALKDMIDNLSIPDNIGPSSIVLNSSTEASTKQFLITVSDPAEGEDPELTVTEITPDAVVDEGSET